MCNPDNWVARSEPHKPWHLVSSYEFLSVEKKNFFIAIEPKFEKNPIITREELVRHQALYSFSRVESRSKSSIMMFEDLEGSTRRQFHRVHANISHNSH